MKLDHISIINNRHSLDRSASFQIRAELNDIPTTAWRVQFQNSWLNSPKYKNLSNDVQVESDEIIVGVTDSCNLSDSIDALRNIIKSTDSLEGTDLFRPVSRNRKSVI
jgi:hypothetical protein